MSYEVFARAYRPQRFDDVVGQDHVTRTLTRSFENDRLGHAYIFSGPRGIGKTTTARLLAKLVNCKNPDGAEPCNDCESCERIAGSQSVDVMEIDGASNNSVDQVRDLRENVQYAPAQNDKKIYIIDEVHMLSNSAFNALLKTLEEPPDHVIFIFATTEIENVPDTILSRCQRYDFRLIPTKKLVESLRDICEREDIPAEDEALFLIARFAEGSLRDAQSILDQMINSTGAGEETLTADRVSETWGLAPYDELISYLESMADGEPRGAVDRLHEHVNAGHDLTSLLADLTEMIRNLTLLKTDPDSDYLERTLPAEPLERLGDLAPSFTGTELRWMFDELVDLHEQVRSNSRFQLQLAEVGLVRIIDGRPKYNLSEIIERLESLEETGEAPAETSPVKSTSGEEQNNDEPPTLGDTGDEEPAPSTAGSGNDSTDTEKTAKASDNGTESSEPQSTAGQEPSVSSADSRENDVVKRTGQPAQAYLRESNKIVRKGDQVVARFTQKWSNHADKLRRDQHMEQFREAIRDVYNEDLEPVVRVDDGEPVDEHTEPNSSSSQQTVEEQTQESDSERLIEQTKQVFDVEDVQKLDDS